jgi:hypothetical protein
VHGGLESLVMASVHPRICARRCRPTQRSYKEPRAFPSYSSSGNNSALDFPSRNPRSTAGHRSGTPCRASQRHPRNALKAVGIEDGNCEKVTTRMPPSVIVWDLETVPDLDGFAAANDLVGRSEVEVREAIGDKFPKHIYHSIVCIGALIAHWEPDHWAVDAVGAPHVGERTEKELITAFCDKIAELHEIGAKLLIGFDIIDWPIGIVSQ